MSDFKKIFASIGFGAATVDTVLYQEQVWPGGTLSGEVRIKGGDVTQQIEDIYFYITTRYIRERSNRQHYCNYDLVRHCLHKSLTVYEGSYRVIPFAVLLPYETPLTYPNTPVFLRTGLDIHHAIDPKDTDAITVIPTPLMERCFRAIAALGFYLKSVECEYHPSIGRTVPFVQEFEYAPSSLYRGRVTEIEVMFFPGPQTLDVVFELDRKARGLMDLLEHRELYTSLRFTEADLARPDWEWVQMLDTTLSSRL